MEETAYAKINLALHVRAREAHGYHRIETLFAFAEEGDRLGVEEQGDLVLRIEGPFADALGADDDNLVMKAARALRARFGVAKGAQLILDKRLPVASGIGGGSADAAAALRLLNRWWKLEASDEELIDIARGIGADVAACLWSITSRGEGRGDRLRAQPDQALRGMPLLLVNPLVPVSTGAVFAGWDRVDRGPLGEGAPLQVALSGRNDLEAPARRIAPIIDELLATLRACRSAVLVRMSGSGATCFALFPGDEERDEAAGLVAAAHPAWWQLPTRLR